MATFTGVNIRNRPKSRLRRGIRASTLLVVLAIVAASCTSGSDDQRTVTIYSGRTENLIGPILDDFTAETGISVQVRYGDSADLALLISEEGNNSPADVFLSQSPGAVSFLQSEGALTTLPAELLALVPEGAQDPNGEWLGFSGRQRVLVYNPEEVSVDELPDSIFDLTDERFRGQVGLAPSNGSFQDFVTAMRATESDDVAQSFLTDLAANDPVSFANNSAIVAAVGRGEIPMGLVNHYYNFRAIEEDASHPGLNHYFAPNDPGSVLIITGAAILDGADNSSEATELIRFLLQEEGQTYFATETFEYPLASGVSADPALPPLDFTNISAIDFSELGGGLAATRELIRDAGLDG